MRSYVAKVILCLLVILSSESTHPVLAASDSSEQSVTTESSTASKDCRISKAARDAINSATDAAIKNSKISMEALDLIDQAEIAAAPPECDNEKAITLANQAIEIAKTRFSAGEPKETDEENLEPLKSATVKYKPAGNNPFAFPNCDFTGKVNKEFKDVVRGDPFRFFTYSSTVPLIYTINFLPYISSKASGTSGCEKVAYIKLQQHRFAFIAKDNLVRDMANGSGEYVTTMAYLQGCPTSSYTHYANLTQSNFADIFPRPETDSSKLLSNLEFQIAQDPFLSGTCKWAS